MLLRMQEILRLITLVVVSVRVHDVNGFVVSSNSNRRANNWVSLDTSNVLEGGEQVASMGDEDSPDMKSYASGYKTVFEELPCRSCSPSEGKIPDDLRGSYFRCGPAMFSAGSIVPPKTSIVQPKKPPVPDGTDPERMVMHPFEGDGAILGITFSGSGTATTRFRYVRTAGFTNERKKGQKLYSGMDSTRQLGPAAGQGIGNDLSLPFFRHHLLPGLNKNRKNTSNTRAVYFGKRLITLWEGGLPYKLDPLALSTDGRSQLGGMTVLKETDPFGAKFVYDSVQDRGLFYGVVQGSKSSDITVYEFNNNFRLVDDHPNNDGSPSGKVTITVPGFAAFSDFGATQNYSIFVQPKITVNGMQFMVVKEPGKVLSLGNNEPSLLHLIARVGSSKSSKSFSIPLDDDGKSDIDLQFCNSYENYEDGTIVMDVIRSDGSHIVSSQAPKWPWTSTLKEYASTNAKKSLWRYTVHVPTGAISKELMLNTHCSFGGINPAVSTQKHRYIYMNVGSTGSNVAPPQGIAKFDCETRTTQVWMPEPYEFCGEPMYASKVTTSNHDNNDAADEKEEKKKGGAEDSGYILLVLFNGRKEESELLIFSATDITSGPMTRIPLGIAIPHGLYGCFTSSEEAMWDEESIERRAKLADKMESRGNMWNEVKSDFSGLGLRLDDIEEIFPGLS